MKGPQLRAIREKLGLTLHEFGYALGHKADSCNVNVCQWEGGQREIPHKTARLAIALALLGRRNIPEAWLKG
jgi:hypothetical protein